MVMALMFSVLKCNLCRGIIQFAENILPMLKKTQTINLEVVEFVSDLLPL